MRNHDKLPFLGVMFHSAVADDHHHRNLAIHLHDKLTEPAPKAIVKKLVMEATVL
jgi:hypothetical protein